MSQVKVTVQRAFSYKGATVEKGQGLSMPVHAAKMYAKIGFVEVESEDKGKLEEKKAPKKAAQKK